MLFLLRLFAIAILGLFSIMQGQGAPSGKNAMTAAAGGHAGGPQLVDVGFWPTVIYNLDVDSNTFSATTYVWFTWTGPIDPSETAEFINNVESWGLTKVKTYPKPIDLPDGRKYQCLRLEGRFFQLFSLKRFPLEKHALRILLEDNTNDASRVIYRFDRRNSGIDPHLNIPGWCISQWNGSAGIRHYPTNLGDATLGDHGSDYGSVIFEIEVTRPVNYFVWKMLLPLIIILLANWTALLLHPSELSSRAAMSGTALLTTVFMQQGYTAKLPEVNYLVLMDKIYVVVYLLILISLMQVVFQGTMVKHRRIEDLRKVMLLDKISVGVQALFFAVSVWLIIATTR
jgi:hypothetical protein